jgi:hypothetical protein
VTQDVKQAVLDDEHLRLLALFHYIFGGLGVAFALLGVVWTLIMATMIASFPPTPEGVSEEAARQFRNMPAFMMALFGVRAALGVVYGILQSVWGRCIARRRARLFTLIVALPGLLFLPYGTLLSVFTFVVMERASVERLYRGGQPEARLPAL